MSAGTQRPVTERDKLRVELAAAALDGMLASLSTPYAHAMFSEGIKTMDVGMFQGMAKASLSYADAVLAEMRI